MGVFCKKVENGGVFCKKVNLSSTQGALCTVSVFFILHLTYLGGGAPNAPPPAYEPALQLGSKGMSNEICVHFGIDSNFLKTQCGTGGRKLLCQNSARFVESFRYNTGL